MKKIVSTLAVLAVVATGALALTAFRHHHDPAQFQQHVSARIDQLLDDVHATDAQRQQIVALRDKLLADAKALHASNADTHQQLLAQWQADQPDATKVHALVDGRAAAMKGFADEVADAMIQVHGILTPDQRATVTQKLQRHGAH
jgi:Spy/CpxP family protein refolding chaperone